MDATCAITPGTKGAWGFSNFCRSTMPFVRSCAAASNPTCFEIPRDPTECDAYRKTHWTKFGRVSQAWKKYSAWFHSKRWRPPNATSAGTNCWPLFAIVRTVEAGAARAAPRVPIPHSASHTERLPHERFGEYHEVCSSASRTAPPAHHGFAHDLRRRPGHPAAAP